MGVDRSPPISDLWHTFSGDHECLYKCLPIYPVNVEIFHGVSENLDLLLALEEKPGVTKVSRVYPLVTMNLLDQNYNHWPHEVGITSKEGGEFLGQTVGG